MQTVGGTAYYSDKITATIRITEANFDSDDVNITVTRDGGQYIVNPDSRIGPGMFTSVLHPGSGRRLHIVSVKYTDKSKNAMANYTSGEMVIDQTTPTIKVSNVVANSASDEDVYSFTVTVGC